jgi:hypothetical protein
LPVRRWDKSTRPPRLGRCRNRPRSGNTKPFTVKLTQLIELDTEPVDEFCLEGEQSYERMIRSRGK